MLFLRSPRCRRWFGYYTKSTMVDYQTNLEAWLQDASLFRNEPVDYAINLDDLLSNEKANTEGSQPVLGLSDLGWLDEKVDLSIFDNPNGLLDHPNETQSLMEDDAAFLLDFLDGGFNPSYLPSVAFKNAEIEITDCLNSQNITESTSSGILDTHLASPGCTILQVNSPVFYPVHSPASPYSDISEAPEETSSYAVQSPTTSITSDLRSSNSDTPDIQVTVYDDVSSPSSVSEEVMSIEEVSKSVRKRKFVNRGEDIPKVKVILKELPVSSWAFKPKDRRERKKVQNKEAAARYRIKKRVEEQELSGEVSGLESTQKKLKEKHDELKSEIKYLKNLMCEILQKKGILK